MLESNTILRRNARVEYRSLGDGEGGVLLHLDTAAYHGLNEVGVLAWNLLDGLTFQQLLEQLRETLTGVPDTFRQEISDFLDELAERDLIHYGPVPEEE